MTGPATADLISLPEIAELAGVRRPVVTTWRRRHVNFPNPVSALRGRQLFDARQIVDWLVDTGRAERATIEPDLRLHLLAGLASGASSPAALGRRRVLDSRELVAVITALICLRHLDDEPLRPAGMSDRHVIDTLRDRAADVDWDDNLLRTEIDGLPPEMSWLTGIVDELIEAAWGCAAAYERMLAVRQRFAVPQLYAEAVTPAAARLMAGLSGAREHAERYGTIQVADPAAGPGDLLMAVCGELGEDASPAIVAAEADPFLARLARRRLVVHDIPPGGWQVRVGSELPPAATAADVLLMRLPYQPAETRADVDPFTSVSEVTEALTPGQTAVVFGPAEPLVGALPPYRAAARTRERLLASGRVEAIVALPGGQVPFRPGYQTALWVLRREEPSPWRGLVLLADISDRALTDRVVETLIWDIATWRRNGHRPEGHLRAYASQVRISDLVGFRRPLMVRRPIGVREALADARVTITEATDVEVALDRLAESRPRVRSGLAVREEPLRVTTQSINTLVRSKHLTLLRGARTAVDDIIADGQHRVLGAAELTGDTPIGVRRIDRGVLVSRYPRAQLTEPGDVVITLTPHLRAYHDEEGFSLVEFPARVLRILPDGRDRFTPRVLVALLRGVPVKRPPGAVRAAARVADLQLPLLPPADVARLDAMLAAVDARRNLARRELELLDHLNGLAVSGLTDGKLTITDVLPPAGPPGPTS